MIPFLAIGFALCAGLFLGATVVVVAIVKSVTVYL